MKAIKKTSKKIFFRTLLAILVVCFVFYSLLFLTDKEAFEINISQFFNTYGDAVIIELWHIETFEGGSTSRATFLNNQAVSFNKKTTGSFISIKTLSVEQAELNMQNNYLPDMVSFGTGAGELFMGKLIDLDLDVSIRDDLLVYGQVQDNTFAYPFMLGGYATISHESLVTKAKITSSEIIKNIYNCNITIGKKQIASIGYANDSFINFATALQTNNIVGADESNFYQNELTSYGMYEKFLTQSFVSLVATQRDVIRCKNREEKGTLNTCIYNYLSGYSDLVQYLGILTNQDAFKLEVAKAFTQFLLSNDIQKKLTSTGMFSVKDFAIYESGYLYEFEKQLLKPLTSVNAFITKSAVLANKQNAKNLILGG